MARQVPSMRARTRRQNRQNFEREEELARQSEAKLGRPLVLGEKDTKSGKARNRVIQARLFGPAIRRVENVEDEPKKRKAKPKPLYG